MGERPIHILLVDHHGDFRFSARLVLEKEGYRVVEAGTGEEALYRILVAEQSREPVELVLTEYRMPGISGLELLEEVRAREVPVPPCILMGAGALETTDRPTPPEVLEKLEKPFGPGELIAKVKAVLARGSDRAA